MAQSGHSKIIAGCPLSGVKRTCRFALHMSAFDPKRTLGGFTADPFQNASIDWYDALF